MRYLRRACLTLNPNQGPSAALAVPGPAFETGADWMGGHLVRLRGRPMPAPVPRPNFTAYGWLKYGLSMSGFGMAAWAVGCISYWLLPLAELGFYLVEIQFLFLFPLLLEGGPAPLRRSCRLTARIGYGRCLAGVLPVAAYMLAGLLRPGRARRQWHVGCLAILLWYVDETPAA